MMEPAPAHCTKGELRISGHLGVSQGADRARDTGYQITPVPQGLLCDVVERDKLCEDITRLTDDCVRWMEGDPREGSRLWIRARSHIVCTLNHCASKFLPRIHLWKRMFLVIELAAHTQR